MGISIVRILKCAGISAALSALIMLILSVLSYATSINEKSIAIFVYVSVVICVFVGAFLAAHSSESKALLNALGVSAVYYAALAALTLLINGGITFNTHCITMTAGIFAAGILGATVGK